MLRFKAVSRVKANSSAWALNSSESGTCRMSQSGIHTCRAPLRQSLAKVAKRHHLLDRPAQCAKVALLQSRKFLPRTVYVYCLLCSLCSCSAISTLEAHSIVSLAAIRS